MLICITSDVSNLSEGAPIKNSLGPRKRKLAFVACRTVLAAVTTVINRIHTCLTQSTEPVTYAENFHGGFSFRVMWWSFVFGVRRL